MTERFLLVRPGASEPMFLHFLNREFHRFVGFTPSNSALEVIFACLLLFTSGPYYSSLSFLAEDLRFLDQRFNFLRHLQDRHLLRSISDSSTLTEHITERQLVYGGDAGRYPMYFEDEVAARLWVKPTIIKQTSATSFLSSNLQTLLGDEVAIHRLPFQPGVVRRLEHELPLIERGLRTHEGAAITLTLFLEGSGIQPDSVTAKDLGRLISYLHLTHYLQEAPGEIVTGIEGLTILDRSSRAFPLFDMRFWTELLRFLHLSPTSERRTSLLEWLTGVHSTAMHELIVQQAQLLIGGCLHATSSMYQPGRQPHDAVLFLRRIIDRVSAPPSEGHSLEAWANDLVRLVSCARNVDRRFREYMEVSSPISPPTYGKVLIVCAAEVEITAALRLAPEYLGHGYSYSANPMGPTTVHSLGIGAGAQVSMVQVEAGDEGTSSVRLVLQELFAKEKPDCVILAGICAGLRPDKSSIGDILVSRQMQAYALQRRMKGADGKTKVTLRGPKSEASPTPLDRFRAAKVQWTGAPVEYTLYASGPVLADDEEFVKEILDQIPEARALEMEGQGVYASCGRHGVDWIIVKAICDWGRMKDDRFQVLAADNALRFVFHTISKGGFRPSPALVT